MIKKSIFTVLTILLILSICVSQECETFFDLNEWQMEGSPYANWELLDSNDVKVIFDAVAVTLFVNRQNISNVRIKGTLSVDTDNDNDFIGIVFGYHKPTQLGEDNTYNFYLFDWKSKEENVPAKAYEGFRLSYYNGFMSREDQKGYFWGLADNPPVRNLLKTKYGDTLGWQSFQDYQFELIYTSNHVRITIDDELIFDVEGCFKAGRFGFYGMSQSHLRFKDFRYQQFIDFTPSKDIACVEEDIVFYPYDTDCGNIPNFIKSISWDFGDGTASTETISTHSYDQAGVYNVELIVYKNDDCIDTLIKSVTIHPIPDVNLGDDMNIEACSSITLDADNPGSIYLWSTGATTQTIELENLASDTSAWVVVDSKGCNKSDTIFIDVESIQEQLYFPNAFTPNYDGENDIFIPVGNTDNIANYHMIIYNRWGQKIFETINPNIGWDGSYNNAISPLGTYIYKVSYRTEGCVEEKGYSEFNSVTLIK